MGPSCNWVHMGLTGSAVVPVAMSHVSPCVPSAPPQATSTPIVPIALVWGCSGTAARPVWHWQQGGGAVRLDPSATVTTVAELGWMHGQLRESRSLRLEPGSLIPLWLTAHQPEVHGAVQVLCTVHRHMHTSVPTTALVAPAACQGRLLAAQRPRQRPLSTGAQPLPHVVRLGAAMARFTSLAARWNHSRTELHPNAYLSVFRRFIRVFDLRIFCTRMILVRQDLTYSAGPMETGSAAHP